jgi:restriction system protein
MVFVELFCKIYFENLGYAVRKTKSGADGGADLLLYNRQNNIDAIVQCKARKKQYVGVNYIRELLGTMTAKKIKKGILITNSYFTNDALMFASENSIETIDVATLARQIIKLEPSKKRRLLDFIETHDYTTPTCPNCEICLL